MPSVILLPSSCTLLHYVFDAQLLLQPQLVPHRKYGNPVTMVTGDVTYSHEACDSQNERKL